MMNLNQKLDQWIITLTDDWPVAANQLIAFSADRHHSLKVRQWTCAQCGAEHDRDVNAAINTLIAGAGLAHERLARVA